MMTSPARGENRGFAQDGLRNLGEHRWNVKYTVKQNMTQSSFAAKNAKRRALSVRIHPTQDGITSMMTKTDNTYCVALAIPVKKLQATLASARFVVGYDLLQLRPSFRPYERHQVL
jgi:hypothetical protein